MHSTTMNRNKLNIRISAHWVSIICLHCTCPSCGKLKQRIHTKIQLNAITSKNSLPSRLKAVPAPLPVVASSRPELAADLLIARVEV